MSGENRGGLTTADNRRGTIVNENNGTSKRGRQVTAGISAVAMVSFALIAASGLGAAGGGNASADWTIIAGTAVTCTDSTVTGDVAEFGHAVTQTNCNITGSIHAGDGAGKAAYNDFLATYDAISQMNCDQTLITLDGQTLSAGTYCFDAAATSTNSVLTLTGAGPWLFKIGTLGTGALTGTGFSVVMADGSAVPCDLVTWWVAQAVTLTDSQFVGNIYAGASITITRGTFNGDAFAKVAVTLTGTTVTGCAGSGTSHGGHGKCNQGVGNGPENCDPGNSNQGDSSRSNDELGGTPGSPGRQGGNGK